MTSAEQLTCDKHGPYTRKHFRDQCPECAKAEQSLARAARAAERIRQAGIPKRYAGKGFDAFQPHTAAQRHALEAAQEFASSFQAEVLPVGRCLVFAGPPGTGKTHLAMAIMQALLIGDWSVRYTTALGAIRELRGSWGRGEGPSEAEVIRRFAALDLLVIDEIGVQYGSEAERIALFEVINARYLDMRPTIVVGNCTREEFATALDPRVLDRLAENGGKFVVMDGASARRAATSPKPK